MRHPVRIYRLLFKILHAALKDLHILLTVDVHGYRLTTALRMSHLAQDTSIRAGNALDSHIRAVRVPELFHGSVSVFIYVLGSDLAVCCQLL